MVIAIAKRAAERLKGGIDAKPHSRLTEKQNDRPNHPRN